jgi:hypothetical protein
VSESNVGRTENALRWAVFLSIALVEILLIVKLFMEPSVEPNLLIAIVIVAGFLILSPRVFDLVRFGVGKEGFSADLQQQLNETNARIDRLFLLTMSGPMYENLRKLASGLFGPYTMSVGLRRELYHLRDIGYVEVNSISEIPSTGKDLSAYVQVTPVGAEFVKKREKMREGSGSSR